jgi:voltage-gated potassium channel
MNLKNTIYKFVEKGSHGKKTYLIFDYAIMSIIVLSLVSIILESIKEISSEFKVILFWFDIFSVSIFSVEYLLRIYVSDLTHPASNKFKSLIKFMFSIGGLIDLFAIIPFYLPLIVKIDLRFLRTLRLFRFLRILKINRYTKSLNLIWEVLKDKKSELAVTSFITLLLLILASFVMYNIEGDKQPNAFPNILASFWWAVATLTTVGYGDIYPITGLGKFTSGVIALMGIGVIALPTGIIGSGFIERLKSDKDKQNHICPHCGRDNQ